MFNQFMQDAVAYADNRHQPQDSRETRNERALEYCRQRLDFPIPPGMEYVLKEMIENPRLILADVRVCRDHVQKRGHCFNDPDLPKCSIRAAELRRDGNLLYARKTFEGALGKYNESICCAPNDSEDLGIGYANRSAIYYEQKDYQLALANIALAKRNNYPERLMPKLMTRESICIEKLEESTLTRKADNFSTLTFNMEANPRVPFLSKGISARQLPIYGNSLVAERGFQAGDVILHEKPLKVSVNMTYKFILCNHCLSGNLLHLIPCPNCTAAMFCNEECLREGFKMHRFECGATTKMARLIDYWLGPRMFFHGLTLFNDDVDKLMAFCQANKETEKSFFDMDYSDYDPLEEFKIFVGTRFQSDSIRNASMKMNAAIYYSMFMEIPLVRSLFTTEAQKNFMVECFFDYMHLTSDMDVYRDPSINKNGQLYPVASICNHSCDPNTLSLPYGGQMMWVVLRPIRRGEQILVSYGPHYSQPPSVRANLLTEVDFVCACDVCDGNKRPMWLAKYKKPNSIPLAHCTTVSRMAFDRNVTDADRMNALQQFVQRYAALHPQKDFSDVLNIYILALSCSHQLGVDDEIRKKISG